MKMKKKSLGGFAAVVGVMILFLGGAAIFIVRAQNSPSAKVISLNAQGKDYVQLLGGPPETVTMRSGHVVLAPGKSVGRHSTEDNEEVLVILEGRGEFRITGGETLALNPTVVAYCPPKKEHDVHNTGIGPLSYVYIVAKAKR